MRNHDRQILGFPAGIVIRNSGFPSFPSFSGFSGFSGILDFSDSPSFHDFPGFPVGEDPGKQWKLDGREGKQLIGGADELVVSGFPRGGYGNRDVEEAEIGVLAVENEDNGGVEADDGGSKRERDDAFLPIHAQKRAFFGHELASEWNSNRIRIDIPHLSIHCASKSLRSASLPPPPSRYPRLCGSLFRPRSLKRP